MSTENNKAAKRRYFEAFNQRNLEIFDELFAPDYVLHVPGSPDVRGPEALKQLVTSSFQSLSEIELTIDDMLGEGDKVVTRWTLSAIHTGEFFGVAPTHKRVTLTGTIIDRFVDGRVVEAWENFDALGLMQQLGAIPPDE